MAPSLMSGIKEDGFRLMSTLSGRPRPQHDTATRSTACPGDSATISTTCPDDSLCYICLGPEKPGARLGGFCTCRLPVHAKCIKKWMDAYSSLDGRIIVYNVDICSACKGDLNVENIDQVTRRDRLEAVGPSVFKIKRLRVLS